MSTQPSLPHKTSPELTPNFFPSSYFPFKAAYTTFGTSVGHERVCRLFGHYSGFALGEKDALALPVAGFPEGKALVDVAVRGAEPDVPAAEDSNGDNTTVVARQHFTMQETIPVFFGLFTGTIRLMGTLSWVDVALASLTDRPDADTPSPLCALYESIGNKLRIFTPDADDPTNKTQITERIEGWAPVWARSIVQK